MTVLQRTTPEAARLWVVDTIKALVPGEAPTERFSYEPSILEGEELPSNRARIFALTSTAIGPSQWCLGGSVLRCNLMLVYVQGRNAIINQSVRLSDLDQIQQTLENRSSWTTGVVGIQVGEATITQSRESASYVMMIVPLYIDYLPKGL